MNPSRTAWKMSIVSQLDFQMKISLMIYFSQSVHNNHMYLLHTMYTKRIYKKLRQTYLCYGPNTETEIESGPSIFAWCTRTHEQKKQFFGWHNSVALKTTLGNSELPLLENKVFRSGYAGQRMSRRAVVGTRLHSSNFEVIFSEYGS